MVPGASIGSFDLLVTSHTKDGATSYGLDWNGRSLCLQVFNVHGDGKVWWREAVSAGTNQVALPLLEGETITYPAPRHQVYDVINETIEANEIDPALWYPEGHMPELVREWPLTTDIKIPNPFAKDGAHD